MSIIRELPVSLINKIAAGEVIERPASVVKELLENSIDAGATQIELTIDGGGIDLIRIADNGCGIAADELSLAVAPHATSKLVAADDLFNVRTLGFRGEALASIAEVSHLSIRSRRADDAAASELICRGSEREGPHPCAAPVGTTIEVRNLFYSTPVRRKFLKTPQTEMGHTLEAFTRIALAYPQVAMTLKSGGRTQHELPATTNWSQRIYHFFGNEVADNLIPINRRDEGIGLSGYVVHPSVSRGNNRLQYLFLNGRYIRDRALGHALTEAYRGLLLTGRFPICFLNLHLAADQVDVNVHPTKCEVRFLDGGLVYRGLLQSLRGKFLSSDLDSQIRAVTPVRNEPAEAIASRYATAEANGVPQYREFEQHERQLLNWARGQEGSAAHHAAAALSATTLPRPRTEVPEFQPFDGGSLGTALRRPNDWPPPQREHSDAPETSPYIDRRPAAADRESDPAGMSAEQGRSHLGFQVHNRYLITQDDSGMVVIDQHALHERILYEQLKARMAEGSIERQRLLIPEPVTLSAAEAALALQSQELLSEIGIEVEPFGGDSVLVTSYPAMLANLAPAEMLRQVLERLAAEGAKLQKHDVVDSLLHLISCKAAIKAGDRLTPGEITALLEQRDAYADTHHCPHGRPTALRFSRAELDKMFKRT